MVSVLVRVVIVPGRLTCWLAAVWHCRCVQLMQHELWWKSSKTWWQ